MTVMIGIDPHKATHTAVAVDSSERVLDEFKVRASKVQAQRFQAWAEQFEAREWAVESAAGLGYLVAQQLVAAGEIVFDVAPMLASRVRVLGSGRSQKNDPNDARSIAIAALRSDRRALVGVGAGNSAVAADLGKHGSRSLGSRRRDRGEQQRQRGAACPTAPTVERLQPVDISTPIVEDRSGVEPVWG